MSESPGIIQLLDIQPTIRLSKLKAKIDQTEKFSPMSTKTSKCRGEMMKLKNDLKKLKKKQETMAVETRANTKIHTRATWKRLMQN